MELPQHPPPPGSGNPGEILAIDRSHAGIIAALDSHAIVAITDRGGRITCVNDRFCEISGYSRDELLGNDHRLLSSGRHSRSEMKAMWATIGRGRVWHGEFCNRAKNGSLYWVQSTIAPIVGSDGRPQHYVSIRTDISHLRQLEAALSASEQRFRRLFERSADALLLLDVAQGRFIDCNLATVHMLGLSDSAEVIGQPPAALSPPVQADGQASQSKAEQMIATAMREGSHRFEWLHCSRQRPPFPVEVLLTPITHDDQQLVLTTWRDISTRKRYEAQIERLAYFDDLTQLPNRALLTRRLNEALQRAAADNSAVALLCIDLDRFKEINDSRGHSTGDQTLIEVAQRLRVQLDNQAMLARTGGDEFAIITWQATANQLSELAIRLRQSLKAPVQVGANLFSLDVSIGVSAFPDSGNSVEELLRQADIAMYQAKSKGGGHCFYQPSMGHALVRQLDLAERLDEALVNDQLQVFYQPLIDLRSRKLHAVEALLRWPSDSDGWISPSEFVPVAEARGLMPRLGDWVFRQACRQLSRWRQAGIAAPPLIAVNLSAQQLALPNLVELLQTTLTEFAVDAGQFELELTESSVVADPDRAIVKMTELTALGFSLAIDDFGTGYSSLSYLKRFPAHKLKIDISFVRDMLGNRNDHAIVETIIAMATTLRMKTVAEGVENAAQADALTTLGCDCAQGYYFDPALTALDLQQRWLQP